ncbi:DUF29 domain-containing protein [Leptolyngbya sp. FACHB-17]|uniref:DUF29 domain-containing protein n=1 Tax=unclassified Leptolyngbya TaxID=2650499 RepID=UPI0016804CD6|nr:DUF29 domain-containing protein [Leptolyngbya sp. FACHB-17]MBD2079238.1 DUF29 domain-containing protein [Leptolyngbya sp. FACHB-17]
MTQAKPLYETDYVQWVETTVERLRDRDYDSIDWENLLDEIQDMARRQRRSLKSNLVVLLHLLKWQYQPEKRSSSWESSLLEHRYRLRDDIQDSPSLKPYLEAILAESYTRATKQAKAETSLPLATFPIGCPYEIAAILDDDFLPN